MNTKKSLLDGWRAMNTVVVKVCAQKYYGIVEAMVITGNSVVGYTPKI